MPRRRTTREPGVTFRRFAVPAPDVTVVDGLPVTTVDRTLCDLLNARTDAGHAGRVLADADQRGLTDTRLLAPRAQPYARFHGLPADATGTDLLESLAEQAGFTLRDQQMTTAGVRAVQAAQAAALHPELLLEHLLAATRQPTQAAAALADLAAPQYAALQQLAAAHNRAAAGPAVSPAGESLRQAMAKHYAHLHRSTALPNRALQQAIEALQQLADQNQATHEALRLASNPAILQARQALQQVVDLYQTQPFTPQLSAGSGPPAARPAGGELPGPHEQAPPGQGPVADDEGPESR